MFHLLMHYRIIALKSALSDNEALQRTQIKYRWFLSSYILKDKELFVCIFIYNFEIFIIKEVFIQSQ